MELETSVEFFNSGEHAVVADAYPGHRVRIKWDEYSQDALDSQAMSAVVKFDRSSAEVHTGCGDELDTHAIGRAWSHFEDGEKLARWLVMTGDAYAVEIVQTPGWNSWGFLVAATPQWVRALWTPWGVEPTAEHIAKAKEALGEEAATVRAWIEGEVYRLVPEDLVTVTEIIVDASGSEWTNSFEEWRENDDYPMIGGFIGHQWAISEASDLLAEMVADR